MARLAGHAQRGEAFLDVVEPVLQQQNVRAVAEEATAEAQHFLSVFDAEDRHAPVLAVLLHGGRDLAHRVLDQLVIHLTGDAAEDAEVAGTEEDDVHAGYGGDLVDLSQRAGVFDLDDDEGLLVGRLEVIDERHQAVRVIGVGRVDAALSEWSELRPADDFASLGRVVAARIHDAGRARFEDASHPHELTLCRPDHDVRRTDASRS